MVAPLVWWPVASVVSCCQLTAWLVGQCVGCSVGRLVSFWSVARLVGWSAGVRLLRWSSGRLIRCLVGQVGCWLVSHLLGWVSWSVSWSIGQ